MSFVGEIKRRKVFQIAGVYAVVAWLLVQIIVSIEEPLNLPDWTDTFVIVCLAVAFPITLIVSWAFNVTSAGLVRDTGKDRNAKAPSRRLEYALIAVLVVAVGFLFVDSYVLDDGPEIMVSPATASGAEQPGSRVLANSIAVLPLENLSADPENAGYAVGMHVEIISKLTKLHNLTVIGRDAVLQYTTGRPPLREISRDLGVQSLLTGTFQYANGQIRVAIQLVDPETGANMWADTYQDEFADIFAVQADIAMNVANELNAEFSLAEQAVIEDIPTESTDAYAFFLQAIAIWDINAQDPRINDLLDQAIELDPEFALALGARAWRYSQTLSNTVSGDAVDASQRAERERLVTVYAERAIEADPAVRYAHSALADMHFFGWRWSEAREAYQRAIAASPADTIARGYFGYLNSYTGRHEEAIALNARGLELNPGTSRAIEFLGYQYGYAGEYDAAAEHFRQAIVDSTFPLYHAWLGYMEIARGNDAEALAEIQLTEQLLGDNPAVVFLPELAYAYGRLGRSADAQRLVDILESSSAALPVGSGGWAMSYGAIGDYDRALEFLEEGARKARNRIPDEGFINLMNLKMNVMNDPVLEEPEFVDVRDRLRGN